MTRIALLAILSGVVPAAPTTAGTSFDPTAIRVVFVASSSTQPTVAPSEKGVANPVSRSQGRAFLNTDEVALFGANSVEINDLGPLDGSTDREVQVTFEKTVPISASATRAEWRTELTVHGMKPLTTLQRKATVAFTLADRSISTRSVTYTVTNRAQAFSWAITAESKSLVSPPDSVMTVIVTTTGDRGTNIGVRSSSLQSAETEYKAGRESLAVCTKTTGDCETPIVAQGVPTPVYVRFGDVPHGSYSGTVELGIDESPETKSFALTFHRTSSCAQAWGAILIFVGVLASLAITVFARGALATAQALLPAARLRELANARRNRLVECRAETYAGNLLAALRKITDALSTSTLREKDHLPPIVRNPFGETENASSGYAEYLQNNATALERLGYIIDAGICQAAKRIDFKKATQVAAFEVAVRQLDNLNFEQTSEKLAPLIVDALTKLDNALTPKEVESDIPPPQVQDFPTTEQLQWRVTWIAGTVWLAVALITTITGCLALIATNHGFGTWMDLVQCFLWGLGVQTAGQQLQNLTPGSVSSALSVTVPKS